MNQFLQSGFILCVGQQVGLLKQSLVYDNQKNKKVDLALSQYGINASLSFILWSHVFVDPKVVAGLYSIDIFIVYFDNDQSKQVCSLLGRVSPSELGQSDSSSAPKGAGSHARAAPPTPNTPTALRAAVIDSHPLTHWPTHEWAAEDRLISSTLSLLLLCWRRIPAHMDLGQRARESWIWEFHFHTSTGRWEDPRNRAKAYSGFITPAFWSCCEIVYRFHNISDNRTRSDILFWNITVCLWSLSKAGMFSDAQTCWISMALRLSHSTFYESGVSSAPSAVCWFAIPALADGLCHVSELWVQEGRQDVGIAVELRALLCHQIAIFLSPLQHSKTPMDVKCTCSHWGILQWGWWLVLLVSFLFKLWPFWMLCMCDEYNTFALGVCVCVRISVCFCHCGYS